MNTVGAERASTLLIAAVVMRVGVNCALLSSLIDEPPAGS